MLLLHGDHLRGASLNVLGKDVSLEKAEVSENGHYAFIWLKTDKAAPQQIPIQVSSASGTTTVQFALSPRKQAAYSGFSAADVMYLILTDRFADGDRGNDNQGANLADRSNPVAWHGGDFRGIEQHLDYLQQLGITTVWITPAYENSNEPHAYHGYDATDMYAVDPHFGTLDEYAHLGEALHRRGMKLVLDLVPNHVGPGHPWASDPPAPGWFHGTAANHLKAISTFEALVDPNGPREVALGVTEGWFSNVKPDLNQENPLVSAYLIQNAAWWVETAGLDGLRLDTFPYVSRAFWHDFHATLHGIYPHLTSVGEIFNHHPEITSFFAGGAERRGIDTGLDTPFDFPMYSTLRNTLTKDAPMSDLANLFHQDGLYPHPERLTPFLGNHDTSRFLSEPGATPQRMKMGFALLATMRGMPQIYSGDEIAMRGGKDPDNRHDFPGGFSSDTQTAFTVEGRTAEQQEMYSTVSALLHFRGAHPAIQHGQQRELFADQTSLVFVRSEGGKAGCGASAKDRVLVAANRSGSARELTVTLKGTPLEGCAHFGLAFPSQSSAAVDGASVRISVAPETVAIFQVQ